jgi:AmmeMemoRadiSam system protein B
MDSLVRNSVVAGRFYPRDPTVLESDVRSYLSPATQTVSALGCVIPHAGYMFSGEVAGAVYAKLNIPQRCIVMCPNHTGLGQPLSIMSTGWWDTPLGRAAIDSDLAVQLKAKFPYLQEDAEAHRSEHATEVQLPFLQVIKKNFSFVPITLGVRHFEILDAFGVAIAEVLTRQNEPILLIASSDMNHYENDAITRIKDHKAIDRILGLDPRGLFDVVTREDISMCGVGPTVAMLTAAKHLGAKHTELVKYATSGDVSGDRNMVVGYAGVLVQ